MKYLAPFMSNNSFIIYQLQAIIPKRDKEKWRDVETGELSMFRFWDKLNFKLKGLLG